MNILIRITCLAFALFALFALSEGVSVAFGPPSSAFTDAPAATPTPTCFAQDLGETLTAGPTCTPTPDCNLSITVTPFATDIDSAGSDLQWKRFVPSTGGPRWPAALIIPGGRWRNGALDLPDVCENLACAGYLAFSVEYRRACPHTDMTTAGPQFDPPSNGRPPEQTDDIRRAIRAARHDPQCNGKVVLLGFSAGAGHAVWWAIAGATGNDKPDAVVACSGPYDLDNAEILANPNNLDDIENYIGVLHSNPQFDVAAQAASSYWLPVTSTPCPVLLFNADQETIPKSELSTMADLLTRHGGTVESHVLTGSQSHLHAHEYWCANIGVNYPTVKDRSIAFLNWVLGIH